MRKSAFRSLQYTFKTLGFHYGEEALEQTFSENSMYLEDVGIKFHYDDKVDDRALRQRLSKAKGLGLSAMAHKNGNQSWLVCMDMEDFLLLFCKAYGVEYSPITKARNRKGLPYTPDKKAIKHKPNPQTVEDISTQAKAAGMSYGKYVAMQAMQTQNNHKEAPKCPYQKNTRSNY